jgi:hypothetical protein
MSLAQSAPTISGTSPNMATFPPHTATHPLTPVSEPILSTADAMLSGPLTMFPRAVAQQSARTTLSENTVQRSLDPKDTDGPILAEDEHMPVTTSDVIMNATSLNTLSSAYIPTGTGRLERNAMSPPFSTMASSAPASAILSTA